MRDPKYCKPFLETILNIKITRSWNKVLWSLSAPLIRSISAGMCILLKTAAWKIRICLLTMAHRKSFKYERNFDDVRPELKRLLNFIDGRQPEDSFTQDLSKAVESAKRNEKWRHDYMTLQMAYDEKYREGLETGIQQGIERGIEQGIEQGITTSARRMLSSGKYSDSEISEITGLSVEQIQALKNSAK